MNMRPPFSLDAFAHFHVRTAPLPDGSQCYEVVGRNPREESFVIHRTADAIEADRIANALNMAMESNMAGPCTAAS
ncbi:hypothetical protein [Noviherbaspirillum massiliense]|uniref:hypothetical protein n=1 Tax=Noviherbaspirillum massiliense TaxID=1465823 RepID=UPI0002FC58D8|nr:hypothetical protein [Noviherbaspirillum massiliense]